MAKEKDNNTAIWFTCDECKYYGPLTWYVPELYKRSPEGHELKVKLCPDCRKNNGLAVPDRPPAAVVPVYQLKKDK